MVFKNSVSPILVFFDLKIHMYRVICGEKKRHQMDYLKQEFMKNIVITQNKNQKGCIWCYFLKVNQLKAKNRHVHIISLVWFTTNERKFEKSRKCSILIETL